MLRGFARLAATVLLLGVAARAEAQLVVWDLGSADAALVRCPTDPESFEFYPPGVFGSYPTGAWVEAALDEGRCRDWPNVPGECVRLYIASFHPAAGCGCNVSGLLEGPTQLAIHYDEAALASKGVAESSLRLFAFATIGAGWVEVPETRVDTEANVVRSGATGFIMGFRWYALAGERRPTGVTAAPWSAVKSLWR